MTRRSGRGNAAFFVPENTEPPSKRARKSSKLKSQKTPLVVVDYKGQAAFEYAKVARVEGEKSLMLRISVAVACAGGVLVMRNQVGRARYSSGKYASHGLGKGSSDLVCIVAPYGRWLCLEVKREKGGVVSPEQEKWLALVRRYGAVSGVVKTVEEALRLVDEARLPPEWCK